MTWCERRSSFCILMRLPVRSSTSSVLAHIGRFSDLVRLLRRWMRWPEATTFTIPSRLSVLLYKLGDALSGLGWRSPVRTTARREIVHGAVGDPRNWSHLTGIWPTDIEVALTRDPASVQERWFARLYLLKPLIF